MTLRRQPAARALTLRREDAKNDGQQDAAEAVVWRLQEELLAARAELAERRVPVPAAEDGPPARPPPPLPPPKRARPNDGITIQRSLPVLASIDNPT